MTISNKPLVTIAVPSYNQGSYIDEALTSIFIQELPVEVFVVDGGSTDDSLKYIQSWEHRLAGWRSHPDAGQAAAINEAIARGNAPFVCWLNSDDKFLSGGLSCLVNALNSNPSVPAVYGRTWTINEKNGRKLPTWVEPFDQYRLALRCIISQPGTLIRRAAWEAVGGLNESLQMTMDYDLWWRLLKKYSSLQFIDEFVAVNREHKETKTNTKRKLHYQEAIAIVKEHYGKVPLKWWIAQPYAVWYKSISKLFS